MPSEIFTFTRSKGIQSGSLYLVGIWCSLLKQNSRIGPDRALLNITNYYCYNNWRSKRALTGEVEGKLIAVHVVCFKAYMFLPYVHTMESTQKILHTQLERKLPSWRPPVQI